MTPAELIAKLRAALATDEVTARKAAAVCGCHPYAPPPGHYPPPGWQPPRR